MKWDLAKKSDKGDNTDWDYESRQRNREEYRAFLADITKSAPPQKTAQPQIVVVPQKSGFSKSQTCLLMILAGIFGGICLCAGVFSLPLMFPVNQNTTMVRAPAIKMPAQPANQTIDGLVMAGVRLSPYTGNVFINPGPGNWWLAEVVFYNGGSKPVTVSGYDIVLRDAQGREYWYDRGLSMFGTGQNLAPQINPGVSTGVQVVFNLPQQIDGLTATYKGASVQITNQNIVR